MDRGEVASGSRSPPPEVLLAPLPAPVVGRSRSPAWATYTQPLGCVVCVDSVQICCGATRGYCISPTLPTMVWRSLRYAGWAPWGLIALATMFLIALLEVQGPINCELGPSSIYGEHEWTAWPPLGSRCTWTERLHGVDAVETSLIVPVMLTFLAVTAAGLSLMTSRSSEAPATG